MFKTVTPPNSWNFKANRCYAITNNKRVEIVSLDGNYAIAKDSSQPLILIDEIEYYEIYQQDSTRE